MRILVCFKAIEDIDKLSKEDWVLEGNKLSLQYLPKILNCFDESALEMVLRLNTSKNNAFESSEEIMRTAFTIGDSGCERFLKLMLALKFDDAVHVKTEHELIFSPLRVAKQIAEYTKDNSQDFIVLGSSSGHGDNGQTALFLSELLHIPCFTNLIDFSYETSKKIRIWREIDDGIVEEIISSPAVLTVGNAQISYLQVPTLQNKMEAKKKSLISVDFDENIPCDMQNQLTNLEVRLIKRRSEEILGTNTEEKALSLYNSIKFSFDMKG